MKITIDTKEDSVEEIRKIISMLQSLVGEGKVYENQPTNIFNDSDSMIGTEAPQSAPEQVSGSVFANIFGDKSESAPIQQSEQETAEIKEEKETTPEIIPYE